MSENNPISNQRGKTARQQYFRDYGFSCGQRHQQKTDGMIESGISKPLLSSNIELFVVNVFKTLNKIIDEQCPWIWPSISPERSMEFSRSIDHENKIIEAARFAVYPFNSNDIIKTQDVR